MKIGDVVEVEWWDACGGGGSWESLTDVLKVEPLKVDSVGYLVKKDRRYLTIVQSTNANKDADHFLCVPRVWITRVTVLVAA